MDTTQLFNEGAYSDLTTKLSDGTEIKVHKVIVCRANEYFRKLCGPESRFAESKQSTIELKDDDAIALENVLHCIYKLPFVGGYAFRGDWRFWLNLRTTADKYLEGDLSKHADESFRGLALASTNSDEIFDIIETINNDMAHDDSLVELGSKLRKDNIGILLKNDRFRAQLSSNGIEALWKELDELVFAADLVKKHYYLCATHQEKVLREPTDDEDKAPVQTCTVCGVGGRSNYVYGHRQIDERTAWISK